MGYRKRGDSYEVNVAFKGERAFATVQTEAEAKTKLVELKAGLIKAWREKTGEPERPQQVATIEPPKVTSWTLGEALDKTFEVHWKGTKSESFYRQKERVLMKHFTRETRLETIKTAAIDDFKAKLRANGNSQSTINHVLVTLSMAFKIAHEREGVTFRPKMGVKRSKKSRVRWLSEEEESQILGLLTLLSKPDYHDWTCVLVDSGMRPSETKKMTGAWCDFRTGTIHVLESKTKAGLRAIPMTTRVRAILERRCLHMATQADSVKNPLKLLFPYPWPSYQDTWSGIRETLKKTDDQDFVPYCLRHTFATRLVQRGVPVEVIQKLLGHETIDQTLVYAKIGAHQYLEAIAKLEKAAPAPLVSSGPVTQ